MLECSIDWESRKEIFIGAIGYIVHGRQFGDYKEENMKDMVIDKLSEILIREIENKMPKYCGKCEERYIVKLDNRPEMHCLWCKVCMAVWKWKR